MARTMSHQQLLDEIMPWWLSRGWRRETLESKSEYQLLGIRNTMRREIAKEMAAAEPQTPHYFDALAQQKVEAERRAAQAKAMAKRDERIPAEVMELFQQMQEGAKNTNPPKGFKRQDIRKNGMRQIILLDEEDL